MPTTDWITALVGAGAAGTVAALYRGIKDYREGSWRRSDSAVADLERWRQQSDDAREWEALQHLWWRDYAGRLVFIIITKLGAEELPVKEPYPEHPGKKDKPPSG